MKYVMKRWLLLVQVFIRFHILGFVGFMIFSYIHYWQRWRFQSASETLHLLLSCNLQIYQLT